MNTTITTNGLPPSPQAKSGQGAAAQPGGAGTGAPVPAGDSVKLTESARSLQAAAQAGHGGEVDAQRVEHVRRALADGSYRIDAGRIADRLTALDSQLPGKP